MSSGHLGVGDGADGKASLSSVVSGNGAWDSPGDMDQIKVVRIDDTHIAEEQCHVRGKLKEGAAEFCEVVEEEEEVVLEEEEDVFVIEYSNPEEEGESYKFTMSVDRSLPALKQVKIHPVVQECVKTSLPVMSRPPRAKHEVRQKRKLIRDEVEVQSNKSVLELGENYCDVMEMSSGPDKRLLCSMCPPPGKTFKRAAGLAVHLKQVHQMMKKKTFFCLSCQQTVRSQIELDVHTKRHANQEAVFTCHLCSADAENKTGFKGSRMGLKSHLEKVHPGVIPRCDVCNKGFRSLTSYLSDQFRHVGKSPFYCARCQIYEMTERGLIIHNKNHDKKLQQHLHAPGVHAAADNSATDDSDF